VGAPPALLAALARAGGSHPRTVVSTDLFYDDDAERQRHWRAGGATAVEMECATLFTLAGALNIDAGALLVVSDLLREPPVRISVAQLRTVERLMGELAFRAVAEDLRPA
jgi:purine-nucleoside phosphorylase